MSIEYPSGLLLAYAAYALGTGSPGPSNLAVMSTAMHRGRTPALILALGIVFGSTLWGLGAAFGLSAAMARASHALVVMKVLGGVYLLWLAFKSARSALSPGQAATTKLPASETGASLFLRGAAMHLTNPKAILVWLSLVTLALPAGAQGRDAVLVVAGCVPIGLAVFGGYALLFSTPAARAVYLRLRRGIEATLASLFGYAALRMLLGRD